MPPPPERSKAQEVRHSTTTLDGLGRAASVQTGTGRRRVRGRIGLRPLTSCLAASRHTARGLYPPPKAPCAYYDRIRAANDGQWIDFEPIVQSVYERLLVPGDTAGDLTTAVGSFRTSSHARFAG